MDFDFNKNSFKSIETITIGHRIRDINILSSGKLLCQLTIKNLLSYRDLRMIKLK